MTTPKPKDNKAKFRAALERKNTNPNSSVQKQGAEGNSKLRASSGNRPKMFRRKSG